MAVNTSDPRQKWARTGVMHSSTRWKISYQSLFHILDVVFVASHSCLYGACCDIELFILFPHLTSEYENPAYSHAGARFHTTSLQASCIVSEISMMIVKKFCVHPYLYTLPFWRRQVDYFHLHPEQPPMRTRLQWTHHATCNMQQGLNMSIDW